MLPHSIRRVTDLPPNAKLREMQQNMHTLGAYKGRIHVIVPFIGRKNGSLTVRQQWYNDFHGWYRARVEQMFAQFWRWGLVRNI